MTDKMTLEQQYTAETGYDAIIKCADGCKYVSSAYVHWLESRYAQAEALLAQGTAERDEMLDVLIKIAKWEFDIMGDCVAEAQTLARQIIERATGQSIDEILQEEK